MVLCRYDASAPYIRPLITELERRVIPYHGTDDVYRPGQSYGPDDDESSVDAFSIH